MVHLWRVGGRIRAGAGLGAGVAAYLWGWVRQKRGLWLRWAFSPSPLAACDLAGADLREAI